MASVLPVNTFKNIFNLHDYDVGPPFLGANSFRGLRNLHGDCLPILHKYGQKSPTRLKISNDARASPPTRVDIKPLGKEAALDGHNGVQRRPLQSPNALQPISPAVEASEKFEKLDSLLPNSLSSEVVHKTTNCFHDAGQELCYLCYQKERRNIPIYTHEERRRKELEEDRLLQQYQQIKDYEAILKDQDNKVSNRKETQKVAAFNLGIAEAVKMKKQQKAKDFNRSFLFYKRSVSPPVSLSQQKYNDDLADQVKQRERNTLKVKKEKEIVERLEQVQLAEDLIAQREMYMKNKRLQTEEYKKSLDTQLRTKPLPISACYPDSEYPYFGKNEMNYDKMLEKRHENRKLFEDQLSAAAEKKRSAILTDLKAQKEETLMLKRAKTDLLEETMRKSRNRVNFRRDLEDTWFEAARHKMSRELEEKERAQSPGVLLHDQCSKYKKCRSCERKLLNCGESNIWCESRYTSGSRIIT